MSKVSSANEHIVDNLNCSVFHAQCLKDSLLHEQEALIEQDVDALLQAINEKGAAVMELKDLDRQRDALCAATGAPSGPEQMNAVIGDAPDAAEIESAWSRLLDLADECATLNQANGAIIRVRKKHIEDGLSVLRGTEPGSATYARDGKSRDGLGNRAIAEC